jgi:cytochrome c-type biogenesis protein
MEFNMQLAKRQRGVRWLWIGSALVVAAVLIGVLTPSGTTQLSSVQPAQSPVLTVLAYALPVFLAGVFSFLSPCTLPILPAYFAFTFQAKRQQIALMTLAFFLGLATTMTVFGATASLLGQASFRFKDQLQLIGGVAIIAFGVASLLGKGFTGLALQRRPSATFAGTYVYGMTFAVGWSACIGPILGSILLLLATQGSSVLVGALLALIYAFGLAVPLFLIALFFNRLGTGSRAWRVLRGRGVSFTAFGREWHLHTTSILSGLLLITMGYLLASGNLAWFGQQAQSTSLGEWALSIEQWLSGLFGVGR